MIQHPKLESGLPAAASAGPMSPKRKRFPLIPLVVAMTVILAVSMITSVIFGPVHITAGEAISTVVKHIFGVAPRDLSGVAAGGNDDIIWNIRFPRALMSVIIGAGLALSGVAMQAIVRNPLANPYILGISSGASLGATMGILLGSFSFFGQYGVAFGSFMGAVLTSFFVFAIAFSGTGGGNTIKLLLAGMAISAMCAAFTNFIIYMAKDAEGIRSVTFWTMGSLTSASWSLLIVPTVTVAVILVFFLTQYRTLNLLLIGEESATALGVNVVRRRKIYLVASALVTGAVVSAAGTIGFVGLIIPHVVRMMVGADHKRVLPLSVLGGAIFLVWCDVVSRIVMPASELPIGIVTGMIGGPFFIYLMLTKSYGFGSE